MDHQKFSISSCSACGTSPVNHTVLFLSDLFSTHITAPLQKLGTAFTRLRLFRKIEDWLTRFFLKLLTLIRVITFTKDKGRVASGRSQLIWEEAGRRSIEMEQIVFFGKAIEYYRAKINGRWEYFQSIPIPSHLVVDGYEVGLDDKFILARELQAAGIPVPASHTITTFRRAKQVFDTLRKPVIIKPRNGSRGRHTTTNITTESELHSAYALCRKIAVAMVIQEHFFGSVYRGTVVGGKLVGFFKADPPRITGDGVSTISELVAIQNKKKPEKIGDIIITADTIFFLSRMGLKPESVLPAGATIDLSAKTGRFYGGYTAELFEHVHPDFADYFEKAAKVMGAPVVGFDAIMENPTASPQSQRWGIIEGNSLPFIDLHYYAHEGKTRDIAPFIWDLWSSDSRSNFDWKK